VNTDRFVVHFVAADGDDPIVVRVADGVRSRRVGWPDALPRMPRDDARGRALSEVFPIEEDGGRVSLRILRISITIDRDEDGYRVIVAPCEAFGFAIDYWRRDKGRALVAAMKEAAESVALFAHSEGVARIRFEIDDRTTIDMFGQRAPRVPPFDRFEAK